MQLNLLVLRCNNIENSKSFYQKLGFTFQKEQHGKGVEHYSTKIDELIMELYPLKEGYLVENSRLGFTLKVESIDKLLEKEQIDIVSSYAFNENEILVIEDPDGRKIELMKYKYERRKNEQQIKNNKQIFKLDTKTPTRENWFRTRQ